MQSASILIEDELETAVESNTCSLVNEDIHEVEMTVAMTQSLAKHIAEPCSQAAFHRC